MTGHFALEHEWAGADHPTEQQLRGNMKGKNRRGEGAEEDDPPQPSCPPEALMENLAAISIAVNPHIPCAPKCTSHFSTNV